MLPFLLCLSLFFSLQAIAAMPSSPPVNLPVVIDAQKQIECDDLKRRCTATRNVTATHGDVTLYTDQLVAFFSKPLSDPSRELLTLEAVGKVRFKTPQGKGWCDKALYDVSLEVLTLLGHANLETPKQTLSAQKIAYHQVQQKVEALGEGKFVQRENTILANKLTAFFKTAAHPKKAFGPSFAEQGSWTLDHVVATDKVRIAMEDTLVEADWGRYDAVAGQAILKGNVSLLHGDHLMKGQQARVDFRTKQAVMEQSDKGGRIQAILKPKTLKKTRQPSSLKGAH